MAVLGKRKGDGVATNDAKRLNGAKETKEKDDLWTPPLSLLESSNWTKFTQLVNKHHGLTLEKPQDLWQWSVDNLEQFWEAAWDFTGMISSQPYTKVIMDKEKMPGAKFFPGARLNFAENLLRFRDDHPAIIFKAETSNQEETISYKELYERVAVLSARLVEMGVVAGDRIAAFIPNIPEAIVAMLAATSLGAIWSSCSPDFGARGILDRFAQITPKVVFATDGYFYKGNRVDTLPQLKEVIDELPNVEKVVVIRFTISNKYDLDLSKVRGAVYYDRFIAEAVSAPKDSIPFTQLPFDHPVYVMYSSGTTGLPKCLVQGPGVVLNHLKELMIALWKFAQFVYEEIKSDVQFASISGGTDLNGCFALGCTNLPVRDSELQTRGLGLDVRIFDDAGKDIVQLQGELVCKQPFPSMPLYFWNDANGVKYHDAYFDTFPGIWRHGDFAEVTHGGGVIINGRSDATLKPGGVRIGTADIYKVMERMDEVDDSVVVGQNYTLKDGTPDVRILLFVVMAAGHECTPAFQKKVRQHIRDQASPRHMPGMVVACPAIPHTISGKKVELTVKKLIDGHAVTNKNTLQNPESLAWFEEFSASLASKKA
ncbi:hypothetical protein BBI17_007400 [Phytophthora kernoviae]|uniref:AMP-dependent synthetase/ligase domain-containing protein n=1 Tax=Phytophthora kernoviae TaxID=325452 RepID=A0A3R7J1F6_9STRA|nr:hypothetical protein JM18_006843 [Phytophthora kernoviae]RLN06226.1 hypothetical protein BBI17_007400 [Phytophthora kernoviae]